VFRRRSRRTCESKRLKLAGRVGTGFSEKLLRSLQAELEKIGIKSLTDCGEVGT
jgi:ATP-dependent DNA ligase